LGGDNQPREVFFLFCEEVDKTIWQYNCEFILIFAKRFSKKRSDGSYKVDLFPLLRLLEGLVVSDIH